MSMHVNGLYARSEIMPTAGIPKGTNGPMGTGQCEQPPCQWGKDHVNGLYARSEIMPTVGIPKGTNGLGYANGALDSAKTASMPEGGNLRERSEIMPM
jgi:hypothetical protein